MRVTVLGCGGSAGVPMIGGPEGRGDWGECDPNESRNRRTRSSILLEAAEGGRLLVDTGPDLRSQLLACGIGGIDAILFTHAHADHVCGIDEVRVLNRLAGRPLRAYAFGETLDELRHRFEFAFLPWSPPEFYRPALEAFELSPGDSLDAFGLRLSVFEQAHGRVRTVGLKVGNFAYSTDVVELDDQARGTLAGVDTWLVDAFQRTPHSSHAHLGKVVEWARSMRIRRTILTHMGPDMDWSWLLRNLPSGIEPAHDGLVLEMPG